MALFYSSDMPEFKSMKSIYAQRVHKFVSAWLDTNKDLTHEGLKTSWDKVSRTKLGNLLKPDNIRPKKYKNKYICFCEIMRPKLRSEFPNKTIEEITKMLGIQWKLFTSETSGHLYDQVNMLWDLDQKRYRSEKELSNSLSKPKRSLESNYINFCKAKRKENPTITMTQLANLWAENQKRLNSK